MFEIEQIELIKMRENRGYSIKIVWLRFLI